MHNRFISATMGAKEGVSMVVRRTISSPAGPLTLVSDGQALQAVLFAQPRRIPACLREAAAEGERLPIFDEAAAWLAAYFQGRRPDPAAIPLDPQGTPFQMAVWQLLREIPYGHTTTYGALAREIAHRQGRAVMSAQAVGTAVGHNPIAILIPCHRVLAAHTIGGFSGGEDRKRFLLTLENILPKKW